MATSASPVPVVTRVRVADAELDVLFLVAQYLRSLRLSTTVVALLRESGLDTTWLCGPSRELALLREWVFQGEWSRVRELLGPLSSALGERGLAEALARVEKQALLEEFHLSWTAPRRRRAIIEELQISAVRLTKQELAHCVAVLQSETKQQSGPWSLDEARLACFEALVPLFRNPIEDDDDEHKYLTMPHRQLVALLNDALLLHRQRAGGHERIVGITPISPDTLQVDGDGESEGASLRLVEPDERAVRPTASALSRSVDLSGYVGKHHVKAASETAQVTHARNPLVMSMAFPLARPRDGSQVPKHDSFQEIECDDPQTDPEDPKNDTMRSYPQTRAVEDAQTQTESTLTMDQGIEAGDRPEFSSLAHSHLREEDIVDDNPPASSNQTLDKGDEQHAAVRSSYVFRKSKTETVVADAPLEAWCTARRGEIPQNDDADDFIDHEESWASEPDANTKTEHIDPEQSALHDTNDDAPEEPNGDDDDESTNTPLRSYSQLTIDSVVRASVIAEVREAQAIRAMDIAPDGSEMVIGTNARALRVFDLTEPLASSSLGRSGGLAFLPLLPVTLERHKHHASAIYTACYNHVSPAHAAPLIATGAAESSIKVLARWTQQEVWIRGHSGKSRALCFASPNVLCSAASGDSVLRAWDLEAASASGPPCVQRFDGHVGEIQAMAIASSSPHEAFDRRCFVSASMDRTVRLWDLRSAQCARVLARTASPAFALAFQPHNSGTSVLTTGHQDGSVSTWDLRASAAKTSKPLATVSYHQDECRAVSWSPDGQWLMSAAFDGTVCLMEANGAEVNAVASFHQHEDKILQAKWHPTQPAIVTTGADKLVKLWAFT